MTIQAKEPIREAESSDAFRDSKRVVVPFVAPDVDFVLKPLIQSLVPIFNQSINIRFSFPFS